MNNDDFELPVDPALDARLRGTLNAVAATIVDPPHIHREAKQHLRAQSASVARTRRPDRRRRRGWLGIGLAAAVVPVAAVSIFGIGPEYVDRMPPTNALVNGSEGGERYWLVPSFHKDACGRTFGGVELVLESNNIIGKEWNTAGVAYGEAPQAGAPGSGCFVSNEAQWLTDPGRVDKLSQRLGDEDQKWITIIAVHPTVTTLRVTDDARATRDVSTQALPDRPDGPRYAVFTTPARKPQVVLSVQLVTAAGQPATTEPLKIDLPNR